MHAGNYILSWKTPWHQTAATKEDNISTIQPFEMTQICKLKELTEDRFNVVNMMFNAMLCK